MPDRESIGRGKNSDSVAAVNDRSQWSGGWHCGWRHGHGPRWRRRSAHDPLSRYRRTINCWRAIHSPDRAVLGPALLAEYEEVLGRTGLFADSVLSASEREEMFDGFLNRCSWVEVFYAWRPNLPDEADNHLIELGVAAQADAAVTGNLRDVSRGELKLPSLRVLSPEHCLGVFPCLP
jgi:predicted nucleic acid-binding protein